jgi:tellurite resistance-related uncharacterized protein
MTYKINRSAVAKLLYGKGTYPDMIPIYHELRFRAGMVAVTAKVKAGKKTGRMAKSIDVTDSVRPPFQWFRIEAHTSYAYYHHKGTKPHIITGSLEFRSHGKSVHTSVVHHPGTRPNPFLRDSLPIFMRVHESGRFVSMDRAMAARYR